MQKHHLDTLLRELIQRKGGQTNLTCEDLLDDKILSTFLALQVAGYDADAVYPIIVEHLESCVTCQRRYTDLLHVEIDSHALLAAYVEAGEQPQNIYPFIFRHLNTCTLCQEELKDLYTIFHDDSPLPVVILDWERIPFHLRTPPLTKDSSSSIKSRPTFLDRLGAFLSTGPVLAPILKYRGDSHLLESPSQKVTLPDTNDSFIVTVNVQRAGYDRILLEGSIDLDNINQMRSHPLKGNQLNIYQIDPVECLAQTMITSLGEFSFSEHLGNRRYVLAITRPEGDEPLVVLDPQLWRD